MTAGPYREVLGDAFGRLPAAVQAMHGGGGLVAEGRADVERGRSLLARVAGRLLGFPPAGRDQPLAVRFAPDGGGETWTRRFGRHALSSRQRAGRGAGAGLLCETMGPVTVASALHLEADGLHLRLQRWRLFGVPMPRSLAPRVAAVEREQDGRYAFDIAIAHPLTGLLVRYRGWLVPTEGACP